MCKKVIIHLNFSNVLYLGLVYAPLPETFEPERQKAQLERMINMQMGVVEGVSSKYDYEKGKWKE